MLDETQRVNSDCVHAKSWSMRGLKAHSHPQRSHLLCRLGQVLVQKSGSLGLEDLNLSDGIDDACRLQPGLVPLLGSIILVGGPMSRSCMCKI